MDDPRAVRLRQALELYEVGEALLEQRLIREGLSPEERAARIRAWRLDRPYAPLGDCVGRVVDIARFREAGSGNRKAAAGSGAREP